MNYKNMNERDGKTCHENTTYRIIAEKKRKMQVSRYVGKVKYIRVGTAHT